MSNKKVLEYLEQYRVDLAEDIARWRELAEGSKKEEFFWPLVEMLPRIFRFIVYCTFHRDLSLKTRARFSLALKYLISPIDYVSELISGAEGYFDDLYIIAKAIALSLDELQQSGVLARWPLEIPADEFAGDIIDAIHKRGYMVLPDKVLNAIDGLIEGVEEPVDIRPPVPEKETERSLTEFSREEGIRYTGGPLAVYAGPGAGKTRMIEDRVIHLFESGIAKPSEILVTTFTRNAANELIMRLSERLAHRPDAAAVLSELTISTIHSLCYKIINEFNHKLLFMNNTITLMGEVEQIMLIWRNQRRILYGDVYDKWKEARLQERRQAGKFIFLSEVAEIFDYISEEVLTAGREVTSLYARILQRKCDCLHARVIRRFPQYWKLMDERGRIDQSSLLSYVAAMLDDAEVRRAVRDRYRYVLVDEYQDTNPVQHLIFRKMVGPQGNIMVVGDDDQSIYGFRGTEVNCFLNFQDDYPALAVVRLDENRRCAPQLVQLSSKLIGNNKKRVPKNLFSRQPPGMEPAIIYTKTIKEQAQAVAGFFRALKENGNIESYADCAVLTRGMNKRARDYIKYLEEEGFTVNLTTSRDLFDRMEVKAMVQLFKFLSQGKTNLGRERTLRPFLRKIGVTDEEAEKNLEAWAAQIAGQEDLGLLELYYQVLDDLKVFFIEGLTTEELGNLGRFSHLLADFEEEVRWQPFEDRLRTFLIFCNDVLTGNVDSAVSPEANAIRFMTIHGAKGMEFDYVVIADLSEGTFPAMFGLTPREVLREVFTGKPKTETSIMEEERRVLYVAMTRAARGLLITADKENPSRFVREVKPLLKQQLPESVPPERHRERYTKQEGLFATHSEIYDYQVCPQKYRMLYQCGFRGRAIRPLMEGTCLHRALEILHRIVKPGEKVLAQDLELIFTNCWVPQKGDEKKRAQIFKIFQNYAEKLVTGRLGVKKIVAPESPFRVALDQDIFAGKIDLVAEDNNGQLTLLEFKYNENPLMKDKVINQLRHYSLAFPKDAATLKVIYLKQQKEETITSQNQDKVRDNLQGILAAIHTGNFASAPHRQKCKICLVNELCKSGR